MTSFEVPTCARPLLQLFVEPLEVLLVSCLAEREFSADEARVALERMTDEVWPLVRLEPFLLAAYRRGVLELVEDGAAHFRVATFYDRLGVFVVAQAAEYLALPDAARAELDAWFFDTYLSRLGDEDAPSGDRVLTLGRTLEHIDRSEQPIWLNPCDCRTLAGHCDSPIDTCITFRSGINTLAHRGLSKPLTKAEAKAVVRTADAAGLLHTVNEDGVCNCCSDCCYLFRAQAARGRGQVWPLAEEIATLDEAACIGCGRCVERCPFGAFGWDGAAIAFDEGRCRGCGLCSDTCPAEAIEMLPR